MIIKTAEHILNVAQSLIQSRGYNAISFNDIAEQVGIKKPSIVHHYPSKADLGKMVIQRYRENFSKALNDFIEDDKKTAEEVFYFYCAPYFDIGEEGDKVCLCGALAGEFMALPEVMQEEVRKFFKNHLEWLERVLEKGLRSGDFNFPEAPKEMAQLILDSLQGALIVQRATGNIDHIKMVAELLITRMRAV